ncbi:hypothetical protein JMUB6875_23770 [Nocardia sp. JMUB6875]
MGAEEVGEFLVAQAAQAGEAAEDLHGGGVDVGALLAPGGGDLVYGVGHGDLVLSAQKKFNVEILDTEVSRWFYLSIEIINEELK